MRVTFHDFVERKATTMRIIYKLVSKWALRRALLGRPRCRHWPEKGRFDATNMDHIYEQPSATSTCFPAMCRRR